MAITETKVQILTCDLCQQVVSEFAHTPDEYLPVVYFVRTRPLNDLDRKLDICHDCMRALAQFIATRRRKRVSQAKEEVEEEAGTSLASLKPVRNEYIMLTSLKHAVESVLYIYDKQKHYFDVNGLRALIEYLRKGLNETVG